MAQDKGFWISSRNVWGRKFSIIAGAILISIWVLVWFLNKHEDKKNLEKEKIEVIEHQ